MSEPGTPDGQTRRDILRRAAVFGGALAWGVPTVQTLSLPAYAGSPGTPGDCPADSVVFRFKYTYEGGIFVADPGTELPDGDPDDPNYCDIPGFALAELGNDRVNLLGFGGVGGSYPNCVRVQFFSAGCRLIKIEVKAGSATKLGEYVCATSSTDTVCTPTGKQISYVAGLVCCGTS